MSSPGFSQHVALIGVRCELCQANFGVETRLGNMWLMPDGRWGRSPLVAWKRDDPMKALVHGKSRGWSMQVSEALTLSGGVEKSCRRSKRPGRFSVTSLAELAAVEHARGGSHIIA